jgi:hypothetical protein
MASLNRSEKSRIARWCLLAALAISVVGCDKSLRGFGSDAADTVASQLVTASQNIVKASDTLALSVPGEYFNRLVRMMGDPNEEVRKQAQDQVSRIFQIAPTAQYRVSAVFGYDEAKRPVLADGFLASVADKLEVERRCIAGVARTLQEVRNATIVPRTRELASAEIHLRISKALDRLANPGDGCKSKVQVNPFESGHEERKAKRDQECGTQARADATELLYQAYTSAYQGIAVPLGDKEITKIYSPVEGKNVFVVLVDEESVSTHADKLSVTVSIHNAKDPMDLFPGRPTVTLHAEQFPEESTVLCGVPQRKVRFAIVPLNDEQLASPELISLIRETEKLKLELAKLANPNPEN